MLTKIVLFIASFWLFIHSLVYYRSHKSQSILPLTASSTRHLRGYHLKHSSFSVRYLHLRLHTTAWNNRHDAFATKLSQHRSRRAAILLRTFYDLGIIAGLLGMLLALGLLFWIFAHAIQNVLPRHNYGTGTLTKRTFDDSFSENMGSVPGTQSFITPIIPGVTVPLTHLPAIVLAVFWSQVVHEFGHAIAAAVENIPVTSIGVSLTLIIPAAFVGFSNGLFDALPPRAQARITAAGPFHNLVFWCVLALIGWSGIGTVVTSVIGYKDVHHIGPVVVRVDQASPLYHHLIPGVIISKLDDTNLGSLDPLADIWTTYLTASKQELQSGWCIKEQDLEPESCCSRRDDSLTSGLSCFTVLDLAKKQACTDPVPILTQHLTRCNTSNPCSADRICILPAKDERLLRITFQRFDADEQQTILWSGPRTEVWEEVEVSRFAPRWTITPIWLPIAFDVLWQYLKLATLSLFFLNLLPLPYLDGIKLLDSLLETIFSPRAPEEEIYDIEALEREDERRGQEGRNHRQWKQRLLKYIPRVTLCIIVICTVMTLLNIT